MSELPRIGCPDGGVCGHNCGRTGPCWRVRACGPFSGLYPHDDWPGLVRRIETRRAAGHPPVNLAVTYHGVYRGDSDRCAVLIESPAGRVLGEVRHIAYHSPTGMGWGYRGSGAADCARSILLDALGDDGAFCPGCNGSQRQVWMGDAEEPQPWRPETGMSDAVVRCDVCDGDGWRRVPYQQFKEDVVARWPQPPKEWRMARLGVREWLTAHAVALATGGTR